MDNHSLRETAAVGLSLLDLTDLDASCTPEAIDRLCARAQTPFGNVAAICIQPRFVPRARLELARSLLRDGGDIARVAAQVGYDHVSNFTTAYRRRFGTPPRRDIG